MKPSSFKLSKSLYLMLIFTFISCSESELQFAQDERDSEVQACYSINLAVLGILQKTYPVENLLAALELEGICQLGLGFLGGEVFGSELDHLEQVLELGIVVQSPFYLDFAGCLEDGTCQDGTVLEGLNLASHQELLMREEGWLLDRYLNALAVFLPSISANPGIAWIVYPELESNLIQSDHRILSSSLRPVVAEFDNVRLGYNPLEAPLIFPDLEVYEGHRHPFLEAPEGSETLCNNDGVSINLFGEEIDLGAGSSYSVQEVKDYFQQANCDHNYVWHHRLSNCIEQGRFIAPRDRVCRATVEEWRRLISEFKVKI